MKSIKPVNRLFIKNMVCPRCIKVVREELEKLNVTISYISLGEVHTEQFLNKMVFDKISKVLIENGFELINDENAKIIEKIKNTIISVVQNYEDEDLSQLNFPIHLSNTIQKDYNYLSSIFSKTEGMTVEHFVILQKIEKVKEYLKYNELTLSEIAYKLGYSSVQHLSRQFKKNTCLINGFNNIFTINYRFIKSYICRSNFHIIIL